MIVFGLVSAIGLIADLFMRMMWFSGGNEDSSPNPAFLIIGIAMKYHIAICSHVGSDGGLASTCEYSLADATGAMTTRHPEGLASALEKLRDYGRPMQRQNSSTAHLFFANPLKAGSIAKLFSTHPPLEDRIARLRGIEGKM